MLSSRGEAVLEVSMHLRTGRMQLKLPPQQAHSLSHESGAALLLKKVTTLRNAAYAPATLYQGFLQACALPSFNLADMNAREAVSTSSETHPFVCVCNTLVCTVGLWWCFGTRSDYLSDRLSFNKGLQVMLSGLLRPTKDINIARVPMQEQTRLATIQSEVLRGPSDMPGGKALHAAQRMAGALELLWVHLNRQQHFSRLLAAAEQLGLHKVQLPPHILQARLLAPPLSICWLLDRRCAMR